jgi:hypothetical protein
LLALSPSLSLSRYHHSADCQSRSLGSEEASAPSKSHSFRALPVMKGVPLLPRRLVPRLFERPPLPRRLAQILESHCPSVFTT